MARSVTHLNSNFAEYSEEVFVTYGPPDEIVTDNGMPFASRFPAVCDKKWHWEVTPYHPSSKLNK